MSKKATSLFNLKIVGGAYPSKTILSKVSEGEAQSFIKNKKVQGKGRGWALEKIYE